MNNKDKFFLLGRATAIIEHITNMPHHVVAKICQHPIELVNPWFLKASLSDSDKLLSEIMSKIDSIPISLNFYEQDDFMLGYLKQRILFS